MSSMNFYLLVIAYECTFVINTLFVYLHQVFFLFNYLLSFKNTLNNIITGDFMSKFKGQPNFPSFQFLQWLHFMVSSQIVYGIYKFTHILSIQQCLSFVNNIYFKSSCFNNWFRNAFPQITSSDMRCTTWMFKKPKHGRY